MKKRHQIYLTEENFQAMKEDFRTLGLPPSAMSALIDDWLIKFAPTLRKMADRKRQGQQLTFEELLGDLFNGMGRAIKED